MHETAPRRRTKSDSKSRFAPFRPRRGRQTCICSRVGLVFVLVYSYLCHRIASPPQSPCATSFPAASGCGPCARYGHGCHHQHAARGLMPPSCRAGRRKRHTEQQYTEQYTETHTETGGRSLSVRPSARNALRAAQPSAALSVRLLGVEHETCRDVVGYSYLLDVDLGLGACGHGLVGGHRVLHHEVCTHGDWLGVGRVVGDLVAGAY